MVVANYVMIDGRAYSPKHPLVKASLGGLATGEGSHSESEAPSLMKGLRPAKRIRELNKTEARWADVLAGRGYSPVLKQCITLALDPPFTSYRPDLAYWKRQGLIFVEVKGEHRFKEKGIAKVALAAKTYPMFRFELVQWTGTEWKESVMTP